MKTTVLAALFVIAVSVSGFSQKPMSIFEAVKHNDSTTLAMCLNAGLKANTTNAYGNTLLMEASRSGSYAAAQLLLAHDAKVNAKDEMGNTALMEATLRGDEQMVSILLHAGASTAIINKAGETALSIADGFEKAAIAKLITTQEQNGKDQYAKLR